MTEADTNLIDARTNRWHDELKFMFAGLLALSLLVFNKVDPTQLTVTHRITLWLSTFGFLLNAFCLIFTVTFAALRRTTKTEIGFIHLLNHREKAIDYIVFPIAFAFLFLAMVGAVLCPILSLVLWVWDVDQILAISLGITIALSIILTIWYQSVGDRIEQKHKTQSAAKETS